MIQTCVESLYRVARCHRFGIAAVPPADASDLGCLKVAWHMDKDPYNMLKCCQIFHATFRWFLLCQNE